jgi:hypothetical protein
MTEWYEEPTQYERPWLPKAQLEEHAGPNGVAVVKVFGEKTQPGWGFERFMRNYVRNFFALEKIESGEPFAIVMRSLRLLVIDIDGKNNGYKEAAKLDLPPTLAETSKSGNGHHLFYSYPDEWHELEGYGGQPDRVGMWPGIDVKSTGVVYHHPHQLWNERDIVELPESVLDQLHKRNERDAQLRVTPEQASEMTDEDLKFKRDVLLIELSKPRTDGRDTSLWRIGASLLNLGVDEEYMAEKILAAGLRWGVDEDTIKLKIIPNIVAYARR